MGFRRSGVPAAVVRGAAGDGRGAAGDGRGAAGGDWGTADSASAGLGARTTSAREADRRLHAPLWRSSRHGRDRVRRPRRERRAVRGWQHSGDRRARRAGRGRGGMGVRTGRRLLETAGPAAARRLHAPLWRCRGNGRARRRIRIRPGRGAVGERQHGADRRPRNRARSGLGVHPLAPSLAPAGRTVSWVLPPDQAEVHRPERNGSRRMGVGWRSFTIQFQAPTTAR